MTNEELQVITDKVNEKINRVCPSLEKNIKTYQEKYIWEVLEERK